MRRPASVKLARLAPLFGVALVASMGCIGDPANPAATQPVTAVDPATTQPGYWLRRPATTQIAAADFDSLWDACERTITGLLFKIDRRDYRRGLLVSEPIASKQFFEFWRTDASGSDLAESSIASIRRTLYFDFSRQGEEYIVTPKVLVERKTRVETKLREVVDYPATYWCPLRRDEAMERRLAECVRENLRDRR